MVKETASGREAIAGARSEDCDIVLLDISMPDTHGLDVLKHIKQADPELPVILLSMHPEEHYGLRTLKAGASGYLTKDCEADELFSAIRKVCNGGLYVSPALAELITEDIAGKRGVAPDELLSDREYQILIMIASGKRVKTIAEKLGVSPKTISTYRTRILQKLNMETNEELCAYARHHGLLMD